MKHHPTLLGIVSLMTFFQLHSVAAAADVTSPQGAEMPANQVFQYMFSSSYTWSDGKEGKATSYLWIPEKCQKLNGLLILCNNVPEHKLVGHPLIREVCAANNLGIVWSTPSFMNFKDLTNSVAFLQQQLDGLAKVSGYEEVSTIPLLPMGESMHLKMVNTLLDQKPERIIAGVLLKNGNLPQINRQTPLLATYGTAYEWGQDKTDIRTNWNSSAIKFYEENLGKRSQNPQWPISYILDAQSGHFDCSERLIAYIANYVDLAAKARLSDDGSLKPVNLSKGYSADLPIPGHEGKPVSPETGKSGLPWYFNEAQAKQAQSIAAINWKAETQLPGFLDENGKVMPFDFNGIPKFQTMKLEPDRITFSLHGTLLDQMPQGFVGAGEKLAKGPGTPVAEWICGPVANLGGGRFQIALDRTWLAGHPVYVGLRQEGTDSIRGIITPAGINISGISNNNNVGKPQVITFPVIPDVVAGTESVPLNATSDAGLPVRYFITAGPAVVKDGKLVFTAIPPRSKFPIEVTVCAWQWGSDAEPKVKRAEIVKQAFKITQPVPKT